jgi:hypothetical protein
VRSGVLVPIFEETVAPALRVAHEAERAGVDGVFCYDHLWPLGNPGRPALAPFPVLSALAAATRRVAVGTLVARVGLVPDRVLLAEFDALAALAPGRLIASLGTGDRMSAGENEAYGVEYEPATSRRERLRTCVRAALDRGFTVWVGDGSVATRTIAAEEGAALNLWDVSAEEVAAESRRVEVTWAGPGRLDVATTVARLAEARASWAVFAWPVDLDALSTAVSACAHGRAGAR